MKMMIQKASCLQLLNCQKLYIRESRIACSECRHSLSGVALGGGVEGGQLHVVEVLRAHLIQDLLERVELTV